MKTVNTILTRLSPEKSLWSSLNVFTVLLSFSFVFLLSWGLSGHKGNLAVFEIWLKWQLNTHPFWYFHSSSVILKSTLKILM